MTPSEASPRTCAGEARARSGRPMTSGEALHGSSRDDFDGEGEGALSGDGLYEGRVLRTLFDVLRGGACGVPAAAGDSDLRGRSEGPPAGRGGHGPLRAAGTAGRSSRRA